jgi:hypothetical protein
MRKERVEFAYKCTRRVHVICGEDACCPVPQQAGRVQARQAGHFPGHDDQQGNDGDANQTNGCIAEPVRPAEKAAHQTVDPEADRQRHQQSSGRPENLASGPAACLDFCRWRCHFHQSGISKNIWFFNNFGQRLGLWRAAMLDRFGRGVLRLFDSCCD